MILAAFASWLSFPRLYQIHDYYAYAMAPLLIAALSLALQHLSALRQWQWLPVVASSIVAGFQWNHFFTNFQESMQIRSNGRSVLNGFLKEVTHPEDVIIVIGADWSAIVPYHTQRRTLMLKRKIHEEPDTLKRILNSLQNHSVARLIGDEASTRHARHD